MKFIRPFTIREERFWLILTGIHYKGNGKQNPLALLCGMKNLTKTRHKTGRANKDRAFGSPDERACGKQHTQ
jgi:hypothetical protein